MSATKFRLLPTLFAAAPLLAACASDPVTAPSLARGGPSVATTQVQQTAEVCETIDFNSYAHGAQVTGATVFGTALTLAAVEYLASGTAATTARAYDTNNQSPPGDSDLEHSGSEARCPGCAGLGRVLVIQDTGEDIPMDALYGGTLTFTGFAGSGKDFYVKSFTAVDVDFGEVPVRLLVDGVQIAQATPAGDGSVVQVEPATTPTINTSIQFLFGTLNSGTFGSGAVDNIEICQRVQQLGEEGCTPGYWKQSQHFDSWVGYTTGQTLGSVFTIPAALSSFQNVTLLAALDGGGGSGVAGGARILLRAAVAALLNSAAVEYGMSTADVIAQVNAALASNNRDTMLALATTLDDLNNAGCPLN